MADNWTSLTSRKKLILITQNLANNSKHQIDSHLVAGENVPTLTHRAKDKQKAANERRTPKTDSSTPKTKSKTIRTDNSETENWVAENADTQNISASTAD